MGNHCQKDGVHLGRRSLPYGEACDKAPLAETDGGCNPTLRAVRPGSLASHPFDRWAIRQEAGREMSKEATEPDPHRIVDPANAIRSSSRARSAGKGLYVVEEDPEGPGDDRRPPAHALRRFKVDTRGSDEPAPGKLPNQGLEPSDVA